MFYYKVDILKELKGKGYTSWKIRNEKILAEHCLQKIRDGKMIPWRSLEKICQLLECQPGNLIGYKQE